MDIVLPSTDTFYQTTTLHRAVQAGDIHKCLLFLKIGCSPNKASGSRQMTPLMISCYLKEKRMEIVNLLLQYGGDPNMIDKDGNNVLHYASTLGLLNVATIISQTMDSSMYCAQNADGNTPIHICSFKGQVEIMEIIMCKAKKHGVDINIRNINGFTPLALAYNNREYKCAQILKDNGGIPKYNKIDPIQETHQVIEESILVTLGIIPEINDEEVTTQMIYPSENNSNETIKCLMKSRFYQNRTEQQMSGQSHHDPITDNWIENIQEYKPTSFANIASLMTKSSKTATQRKLTNPR